MPPSLLGILGLEGCSNVSDADIREAYKALCRQYHPDKLAWTHRGDAVGMEAATARFVAIKEAYEMLAGPDQSGAEGSIPSAEPNSNQRRGRLPGTIGETVEVVGVVTSARRNGKTLIFVTVHEPERNASGDSTDADERSKAGAGETAPLPEEDGKVLVTGLVFREDMFDSASVGMGVNTETCGDGSRHGRGCGRALNEPGKRVEGEKMVDGVDGGAPPLSSLGSPPHYSPFPSAKKSLAVGDELRAWAVWRESGIVAKSVNSETVLAYAIRGLGRDEGEAADFSAGAPSSPPPAVSPPSAEPGSSPQLQQGPPAPPQLDLCVVRWVRARPQGMPPRLVARAIDSRRSGKAAASGWVKCPFCPVRPCAGDSTRSL